jgi:hypothetical protein
VWLADLQKAVGEVDIISARVVNSQTRQGKGNSRYTVYIIEVKKGEKSGRVFKRYSDFVSLFAALKIECGKALGNINLPRKHIFDTSGSARIIEKRRLILGQVFTLPRRSLFKFKSHRHFQDTAPLSAFSLSPLSFDAFFDPPHFVFDLSEFPECTVIIVTGAFPFLIRCGLHSILRCCVFLCLI